MLFRQGNSGLPTLHKKGSQSKLEAAKEMKNIQRAQDKLKDFVEELNDHIKWLLSRKQFMLQGRHYQVLQQLNETKKALALYEKGIRNLERQIEEDPKIKSMKSHIKFYEEYSNILFTLHNETDQEVGEDRRKIAEQRSILLDKKRALNAKNHENIQLASQITKLRDIMENVSGGHNNNKGILQIEYGNDNALSSTKRQARSNVLSNQSMDNEESQVEVGNRGGRVNTDNYGNEREDEERNKRQSGSGAVSYTENKGLDGSNSIYNEYFFVKKKTETLAKKNLGLKKSVIVGISNFNESYELFLQAFHKYEDALYKSQMVVHNQGLNGSLIFLLLNSKKKSIDDLTPVTMKDSRFLGKRSNLTRPFQKQQDGEAIDVIYSTFKKMLDREEKKTDKVKEMVSSVQHDQLLTFTPMQIMGLVLLKPEVLRDIIFEFDEKKKRLIGLSMSLKNVKITEFK